MSSLISSLQDRLVPSSNIKLRDYQEKQIAFLRKKLIANKVVGLQSGTGSGKTFVAIDLAMKQLRDKPDENVVIVTPYNHLVLLMEERALQYGFNEEDVLTIMGKGRLNCPVTWEKLFPGKKYKPFTEDYYGCSDMCLGETKNSNCNSKNKKWKDIYSTLWTGDFDENGVKQRIGKLIITNDTMFLISKKVMSPSLVIIDEAHIFPDYYRSFKMLKVPEDIFKRVNEIIDNNQLLKAAFVEATSQGKPLAPSTYRILENECRIEFTKRRKAQRIKNIEWNAKIDNAKEELKNGSQSELVRRTAMRKYKPVYDDHELISKVNQAINQVKILSIQNSDDVYINVDPRDYYVEKFSHRLDDVLDDSYNIVLMSATLDEFTRIVMELHESNLYIEKKRFIDYSKSEFFTFPTYDEVLNWESVKNSLYKFLDMVKFKNNGLLLFTTIDYLNRAYEMNNIYGFRFFRSVDEYKEYNGKKILLGSKSLFQGMDIPELDFVAIDKLPFLNYNDYEQKFGSWLETRLSHKGFSVWKQRTIPILVNNIIQSSGRLWRSQGDYGIVAVLDPRTTYNYLHTVYRKAITEARPGIVELSYLEPNKEDGREEGEIIPRERAVEIVKSFKNKESKEEEEIPEIKEDTTLVYDSDDNFVAIMIDDVKYTKEDIDFFLKGRMTAKRKNIIGQWKAAKMYDFSSKN